MGGGANEAASRMTARRLPVFGLRKRRDGVRLAAGVSAFGDGPVREQKKTPAGAGAVTQAATSSGAGAGCWGAGAAGRGLVTPAMKRSASLVALSRERQG
jgi:hypothetical protein